jgi:hypothetical protein
MGHAHDALIISDYLLTNVKGPPQLRMVLNKYSILSRLAAL